MNAIYIVILCIVLLAPVYIGIICACIRSAQLSRDEERRGIDTE